MEVSELVKKYLKEKQVMQLATVGKDQPWICNVHYAPSENNVLYWISDPNRRHSQEIHEHKKAAVAIAVKSPDHPVVGIQIEGDAQVVDDSAEIKQAIKLYDDRYKISKEFYDSILNSTSPHKLYKIVPRLIVLFDEENFPNNPRQELKP